MKWSERVGRRIKLRDLHILLAVVQSGSLAKAAQNLAVSKPVISKVIADLEHTVGVRLLDRDRHGAAPTIFGTALLKCGVAVFDDLKQGVEEIEFLRDPAAGALRIGTSLVLMEGILPVILDRLRRRYPRLFVEVTELSAGTLLFRELRERNIDLVFSRIPALGNDFDAEVLFEDPQVVVAGARSRWARRRNIELRELISEPWILPRPDSPTTALIAATFAAIELEVPQPEIICGSFPLMNVLLARGQLLAFWPASVLRFSSRKFAVKILPVKLPPLPRPVGVITLKGRTIGPAAQVFIDCAREVARPLAKGRHTRGEQ
jgi:DNA-binding transcriptional LysR family regulator